MTTILSASTTSAACRSRHPEPIPGLTLTLPGSDVPTAAAVILNVPLFYVDGCGPDQDQGVVFTLQRDGREILARGGYSFPFESRHNGRLPMSLSVAVPLGLEATELSACWEVYGAGLTARIDSHSTLVAIVGGSGEMTASPAVGWESSERSVSRSAPARTAPSEVSIPFLPGYVARVRYDGSGGGALNIHSGKHIALHVNPRPHEALVLNSFLRGAWGPEERPGGFPLAGSGEVTLTVWAGPDAFFIQATEAALKAPFVYRYNYRLPPGRKLDRVTTDLAGLREFSVRPEL